MRANEVAHLDPEEQYWKNPNPDTMWVTDKLILSSKMGYKCGPAGIDVPEAGDYIVRPVVNAYGLGIGAEKMFIEQTTTHIPPGFFWCEWFEGRHLSVDYQQGKQILCVEGFKPENTFTKWDRWARTMDVMPMPEQIHEAVGEHDIVNCEFIGDKLIEVHLRHNPDFEGHIMEFIPVWEGEDTSAPNGYKYREYPDVHGRIGAFIR